MYKFNSDKYMKDVLTECYRRLTEVAIGFKQAMKDEIASLPISGSHKSVGASEWRREVFNAIDYLVDYSAYKSLNKAVVEVGLVNSQDDFNLMFKAFLINYGMGTTADYEENFWAAEYLTSNAYSGDRPNNEVYSRPNEIIYDIETGKWRLSNALTKYEIRPFWLIPSYFFENGIRKMQSSLDMAIESVMDNIDIMDYFYETK